MKIRKIFNEQTNKYNEVEFVCYNEKYKSSTTKQNQLKLYNDLKKVDGLLPYMQDWCEYDKGEQISLAVILLDKTRQKELFLIIKKLAEKNNVEIDLIDSVDDKKINDILKGDLENIIKEEINKYNNI